MASETKPPRFVGPLVHFAQQAGLTVEASPSGSWIRFPGQRGTLYVVQDAWGDGCTLMEMATGQGRTIQHFLDPRKAVAAAIQQARARTNAGTALDSRQAQAG